MGLGAEVVCAMGGGVRAPRVGSRQRKFSHLRVHRVREDLGLVDGKLAILLDQLLLRLGEVVVGHRGARAPLVRRGAVGQRAPLAHLARERLGEAAGRHADRALEVRDDRGGERERVGRRHHVLGLEVRRDHELREVAHHLRRRRHLGNVAEEEVRLRVLPFDLGPPLVEAELLRLVQQVGVLAAGDLVGVDVRRAGELARLERQVHAAHL